MVAVGSVEWGVQSITGTASGTRVVSMALFM